MRVDADTLRQAVRAAARTRGVRARHARWLADTLVSTSLDGIDTHGASLIGTYLKELDGGRAKPVPTFRLEAKLPALAVLDAGAALGVIAGNQAMRLAIARAARFGIGMIVVRNSNHFGAAGWYARLAAQRGMIGIACSNSDALVAAHGGADPLNGTNPLAMSAAAAGGDGFHLDMTTSQVSYSRVKQFTSSRKPLAAGWVVDAAGHDACDSAAVHALQPLGGYKGQGLGLMIQLLCAGLAGMPFDADLSHLYAPPYDRPRQIAHCFVCINVGASGDERDFQRRNGELLNRFRESAPGVDVPGDPERRARAEREVHGIALDEATWVALAPWLELSSVSTGQSW